MTFAMLRKNEGTWADQELKNLEGTPIDGTDLPKYVKVVCFDSMETGLYVLTVDDDYYFTCHSIVLDFIEETEALKKIYDTDLLAVLNRREINARA